ncbi:MAG: DUF3014 domain-containing protein [Panacagrimonas sp.]
MNNRAAWVGLALGLALIGAAFYYLYGDWDYAGEEPVAPWPAAQDGLPPPELASEDAPIQHPVPEPVERTQPLPELEDSDSQVMSELRELYGAETLDAAFVPRDVIRRMVLLIDSLDREDPLPLWLRPVRSVPGKLAVDKTGDALALNTENAKRYTLLVETFVSMDTAKVVALYRRYYPLFQDAYDRIGNPRTRYFNDRLIAVVDHLLDTPVIDEPIALARPKVVYLFADPELESLSSGQKALLRMGRANADRVKAELRELRSALVK